MTEPQFFRAARPLRLGDVVDLTGAATPRGIDPDQMVDGVGPLDRARRSHLSFLDSPRYLPDLAATRAGACLVTARFAEAVPPAVAALVVKDPHRALTAISRHLFPQALQPGSAFGATGVAPGAMVHPTARIEPGATVDPGAVVGEGAEIGTGTIVAATAVVGSGVRVGRQCAIGPGASVLNALIGDRVIIHGGCRIGQDGFGYVMGPKGHVKVPQIGRVIIQDDVEIGAGTTIDRGAGRDTVIGEGSKIDNLVQIGHNVTVGRHCIIVSQVGISGSATLGDFVVIGGKAGVIGHITIGDGAQIAATSSVKDDVPAGARWGGAPAKPVRDWFREVSTLSRLAARSADKGGDGGDDGAR